MAEDYRIHLNFLPVQGNLPSFRVYTKVRTSPQEQRPKDEDVHLYSLPQTNSDNEDRIFHWVSTQPREDLRELVVHPSDNNDLTRWVLFKSLCQEAVRNLQPTAFCVFERGFTKELHYCMREHPEGEEQLIIQPYFLRAARRFGVLADFHFRLAKDERFSRRIQQLSLSLDTTFRRNFDYYVDRVSKIREFLRERWSVLSPIKLLGSDGEVALESEFLPLPAERLRSRVYVFANGKNAKSQFTGLRDYGPLERLTTPPKLLFIFREQDRQAGRTLAMALRGSRRRERFAFPGFEALFKTPLEIDPNPIVLPDFTTESMSAALDRVQRETVLTVPLLIVPDGEEDAYLNHKALFTHAGIPTQVCTTGVIQDENTLKWSTANIALQIFCKAGGLPWKVRPTGEPCLIIGISQSHKLRSSGQRRSVEKYFAFSVLTDSSGLFQKIQVLGDAPDEPSYLEQLRTNLEEMLTANAERFSRVVVHTSFKLKRREIDQIQQVAQQAAATAAASNRRFAVVKVNHKSNFFGMNRGVNSLVPYEGTRVRLGYGEYLIWFEGIFPDKPTVTKAFPGPTHLQFLRVSEDVEIAEELLLQDLVNLSGANWRAFNAKAAPVSVFYCHLVADLVHDLHERGLPLPAVEGLRPWFL